MMRPFLVVAAAAVVVAHVVASVLLMVVEVVADARLRPKEAASLVVGGQDTQQGWLTG